MIYNVRSFFFLNGLLLGMLFVLSHFGGSPHWMKGLSFGQSLLVGLHSWGKRCPGFKALRKRLQSLPQ